MSTTPDASGHQVALRPSRTRRIRLDAPREGLRARKKMETRARLLAAAQALFGARGFEATRMADIAAAARVSTPTVFNYFPNKQLLLIELHREDRSQQAKIARAILEAPAGSPVELICALLRTNVAPIASPKARKLWREIIAATIRHSTRPDDEFAHSHEAFEAFLAEALRRCKLDGTLRQEFDVETAVRTIFAINRNNLRRMLASPAMTVDACVALSRAQVAQLLAPWMAADVGARGRRASNRNGGTAP